MRKGFMGAVWSGALPSKPRASLNLSARPRSPSRV